ncbi:MAG TPA: class I SAM-dependent methyltransferase [Candidatus Microsaccharimonas sp.]|jgi:2-polyprenyl-3-methyl-5-hydroxy-6-metoxy-1,4-benzoquinol methylase
MSNYSDSSFDGENANTSWYKAFRLVPVKSKVLDVGCSSGNFGYELAKRLDCVVDGVEINPKDANEARKKLRNVYSINIETDDVAVIKDTYDIIYFGDVIEHLVDPVAALKRTKTLLSKNGKIIFSIPNMAFIGIRLDLLDGNFDYTETGLLDKTHLHFYTKKEIEHVFEEAGFAIDTFDYVQKDYPKKVIKKELAKVGLTPNELFYKNAAKIEASSFQFVGSAVVGRTKQVSKRAQFGPIDLFETYLNDTVKNYTNEQKKLQEQINELHDQLSRTYDQRLRRKFHSIKNKITRKS